MEEQVKSKGEQEISIADIICNPEAYEFKIQEFVVAPRVEVFNKATGFLVRVFDNVNQRKVAGTINPTYAKELIHDLETDFRVLFAKALSAQEKKRAEEKAKQISDKDKVAQGE